MESKRGSIVRTAQEGKQLLAVWSINKMVTKFNEETQDWSGEMSDFGQILDGKMLVSSEKELLDKIQGEYYYPFEPVPDEAGRFETNQTENDEGLTDPDGKWLADYNLYVEYYQPASFGG